jgi:hypothetical protein
MRSRSLISVGLAVAAFVIASAAHAHGKGHGRVGVYIGAPLPLYIPGPYYYPSYAYPGPYYAYPPRVVAVPVPTAPPTYIERAPAPAVSTLPAVPNWYWCQQSQGYYPNVTECPGGWTAVPAQPAAQAPSRP